MVAVPARASRTPLSYHELVTGFLEQLCTRTAGARLLHHRPALPGLSDDARRADPADGAGTQPGCVPLRFRLSKFSHVGIVVTNSADKTVFATSASFGYGSAASPFRGSRRPGTYGVVLTATDLAGNFARITGASRSRAEADSAAPSRARGPRLAPMGRPRTILYTGKGGVGKTSVAAGTARALRRGRTAHAGDLHRPRAQPVRVAGRRTGRRAVPAGDGLWGQEVKAQEEMERHWSGVQEWLGELLIERGVDRISAEELTVPPGRRRAVRPPAPPGAQRVRRVGRGDRRLRPDRRDAAAALVPRRGAVVDRQGVPLRAPAPGRRAADRPLAAGHLAAQPGRVRRHRAAVAEPDRHERDPPRPHPLHDPAGDEPGQDGDRRGDADVHLPQPLRLSDRRCRS